MSSPPCKQLENLKILTEDEKKIISKKKIKSHTTRLSVAFVEPWLEIDEETE